jgi:alcohol dehydrogenase class IV
VLHPAAAMHTPVEVTATALEVLQRAGCDGLVALGGGSTVGLSKALSLRTGLPQIAIPTTYAGSEVTPILGETCDGVKKTQRDPRLLPRVVIYDVEQTLSLPVPLSVSSGLNAMAHAAEALYARDRNPVISLTAQEGIAAIARSLPKLVQDAGDLTARSDAQYGAWLCGTCLGAVGMALHHKLCHVLGGSFDLPHAEAHAIVLPYALAYNGAAVPGAIQSIQQALATREAPWARLHALARELPLPRSLAEIGMPREGLSRALDLTMQDSYWNPRPLQREPLQRLLAAAFEGAAPEAY